MKRYRSALPALLAAALLTLPLQVRAQVPAPPPVGGGVKVVNQDKDEPGAPDLAAKKEQKSEAGDPEQKQKAKSEKQKAKSRQVEASGAKPEVQAAKPETQSVKPETGDQRPETAAKRPEAGTVTGAVPAAEPPVELPPSPQRKLEISPQVRSRISGQPSEDPSTPDKEMKALSEFEERAFPKPGPRVVPPPGDVSGVEGVSNAARPARPGADAPPEGLTSEGRLPTAGEARAAEKKPAPLPGWISQLTMPDLPVRWTPSLLKYLEYYRTSRRGRAILRRWFARLGRYRKLMEEELRRQDVPRSLIFLAMIESGYDPRRTSRVGAGGLWQFMPFSGKGYGLRRDHWIDERRNPKLSTEAALKFLKDLYTRFGSWELAMASYNAGYGAVQRAIQKYNTNDYWTLCTYEAGLPWSTSLYVPKIMAVAVVDANRKFFGYENIKEDAELTFELVAVNDSVTLAQAARAAGVKTEVLDLLNPELRRDRTPPGVKSWLRVPKGTGQAFYAGLNRVKKQLARYKPYLARLGETVRSIARDHRTSRSKLRSINGFSSDNDLRPGMTILVPAGKLKKAVKAKTKQGKGKGRGKGKGKGKGEDEEEPESILVPIPREAPTAVAGRRRVFYRVAGGETMRIVARHLEVGADELAGWNSLDRGAKLVPGMVLQAFVKDGFDGEKVVLLDPERVQVMITGSEEFLDLYEQRKGRKRLVYTARKGDTLRSVGRTVGLTIGDLARINKFSRNTKLDPGQKIIVYHDPAKARKPKKRRRKKSRKRRKRRRAKTS